MLRAMGNSFFIYIHILSVCLFVCVSNVRLTLYAIISWVSAAPARVYTSERKEPRNLGSNAALGTARACNMRVLVKPI